MPLVKANPISLEEGVNIARAKQLENTNESSHKKTNNYEQRRSTELLIDTLDLIKPGAERNLIKLKLEGCYRGEKKFFFGLYTRKAEYTYYADGKESIAEIKAKFGLKDGAIAKCNGISDENYIPEKGKEIYFYEEDANCRETNSNSDK